MRLREMQTEKEMPSACPRESHVGCYQDVTNLLKDATRLSGGASRSLAVSLAAQDLAANVNLPRASRGHPKTHCEILR